MLDAFTNLLAPQVLERLTLVLNHVLGSEPVAPARLAPHAGRVLALNLAGWPALLPAPRGLAWRVTPAGLLEWCGLEPSPGVTGPADAKPAGLPGKPDLLMSVDAANPAAWVAMALPGQRPAVQVEGDAQLAADIGWLLDNLRWDVAADLERFFGPLVAQQLHQMGRALARGLRGAMRAAAPLAGRFGPGPGPQSGR